jgi:hypothetical protein
MKLKNKTKVLAAAIAFAGMTYLPQVSAAITTTDLGALSNDDISTVTVKTLAYGSFTAWYDFSVDDYFSIISTATSGTSPLTGVSLTSFDLYTSDHLTKINSGKIDTSVKGTTTGYIGKNETGALASGSYSLGLIGNVINTDNKGKYGFSLKTVPEVAASIEPFVPVAAVPLPGAVWLMLTGIVGLFGYQARNKKTA